MDHKHTGAGPAPAVSERECEYPHETDKCLGCGWQAPAVSEQAPTDLSKRLRAIAAAVPKNDPALVTPKCLTDAADEIDRYYGGMLAWKQTAEKKDADWNAERMTRVNERCAARASSAPAAHLTDQQIMRIAGDVRQRNAGSWPGDVAFARVVLAASPTATPASASSAPAVPDNVREFVEAVAGPMATYIDRETDEHCCAGCNCAEVYVGIGEPAREVHTDDCIVLRARALLASTVTSASAQPADDLTTAIAYIADELEADAMNHDGDFADTVKGCVDALRHLIEHSPVPSAQPVAAAPAGWKLVPRKITPQMIERALEAHYGKRRVRAVGGASGVDMTVNDTNWTGVDFMRRIWPALLDAAPAAPVAQSNHSNNSSSSVAPPVAAEVDAWQPVTAPGQVKVGDKLRFTIGDKVYRERAKMILNAGADKEEVIYDKGRNFYFITAMVLSGFSNHKGVEFYRAAVEGAKGQGRGGGDANGGREAGAESASKAAETRMDTAIGGGAGVGMEHDHSEGGHHD